MEETIENFEIDCRSMLIIVYFSIMYLISTI